MSFSSRVVTSTIIVIVFICYAPNIPPYVEFEVFAPPKGSPLEGPLAPNNILDHAERLHENVLFGPESIAYRSTDEIYTGLIGGDIVKVHGKHFEKISFIVNNGPCHGIHFEPWDQSKCGRPLGMRFHSDGLLYVIDSYFGVFAVDVDKRTSKQVFNISKPIEGKISMLPDDLDFDDNGNIYWTDASSISHLDSAQLELLAKPSGRFLKYNIKTKTHKVILDNLHFANGVQMSPNKDFVLVNNFNQKETLRYWLKGAKTGTTEKFVVNLPGFPDNIRSKPGGGYYISIIVTETDFFYEVSHFLGRFPTLKRFLCRIVGLVSSTADLIDNVIPNIYCKKIVFYTFSFHIGTDIMFKKNAMIVDIDENGNIIGSLQGDSGQLSFTSEAQVVGDNLFIGTPFKNWLGRISMSAINKLRKEPKLTPDDTDEKDEL